MESAKAKIARSARYAEFYGPLVIDNRTQLGRIMESTKAKIARSAKYAEFYGPLVIDNRKNS
jgi:hypothetical protein